MPRIAIVVASVILMTNLGLAQDVIGYWVGIPASGGPLGRLKTITVKLSKDRNGDLIGVMYGGGGEDVVLPFTSISLTGSKLTFTIKGGANLGGAMSASSRPGSQPISFVGTLSDDGNSIDGWLLSERLKLERTGRSRSGKTSPQKANSAPPTPEAASTASTPVARADSSAVLSRALANLAGTGLRLLRYTCIETIQRAYYSEPIKKLGTDVMTKAPATANSCDGRGFSNDSQLTLDMEDRLKLEVAVADGKEIHSWEGASGFDSRSVFDLVRTGPKSTGAFGTVLVDIFENPGAHYAFLGGKSEGSRSLYEYAFEVSLEASHFVVSAGNEWKKTAYRGSFEIDADTAELARVSLETAELPTDTQMCRIRTVTDYHFVQIGTGNFLIPRQSQFDTVSPNANQTRSVTTFSACHEYTAESSLVFDDQAPAAALKAAPKNAPPLPPGLSLTLALLGPIDTGSAAAGDAVSARVTKAVRAPGSNEILVAAGAIAHGRILDMQHRYNPPRFQYSLHFDTLEQNRSVSPLAIRLEREVNAEQKSGNRLATRGTEFSLSPPPTTGETGNWFAVPAATGGYVVPEGFESKWVTAAR